MDAVLRERTGGHGRRHPQPERGKGDPAALRDHLAQIGPDRRRLRSRGVLPAAGRGRQVVLVHGGAYKVTRRTHRRGDRDPLGQDRGQARRGRARAPYRGVEHHVLDLRRTERPGGPGGTHPRGPAGTPPALCGGRHLHLPARRGRQLLFQVQLRRIRHGLPHPARCRPGQRRPLRGPRPHSSPTTSCRQHCCDEIRQLEGKALAPSPTSPSAPRRRRPSG